MKSWHVKTLWDAYSSSLHVLDSLHLHVSVAHASASSSGSGFSLALAYMNSTFPFTLFVLLVHCVCFALLYYHFIHWLNSPPPTHRPTHPPSFIISFIHLLFEDLHSFNVLPSSFSNDSVQNEFLFSCFLLRLHITAKIAK